MEASKTSSRRCQKLGPRFCSKMSLGETCLLPKWHPAYSWHELDSGSFVERENLPGIERENPISEDHEGGKYRCP